MKSDYLDTEKERKSPEKEINEDEIKTFIFPILSYSNNLFKVIATRHVAMCDYV